jgi:predicted NUDIX family phosphoesterase
MEKRLRDNTIERRSGQKDERWNVPPWLENGVGADARRGFGQGKGRRKRAGILPSGNGAVEQVVCFRKEILTPYVDRGKVFFDPFLLNQLMRNLVSVPRTVVENDPQYKQLISYVVIRSGKLYLTYRRTEKREEKRFPEIYSIGVGGHVNAKDRSQLNLSDSSLWRRAPLLRAALREIQEEVVTPTRINKKPELVCFIDDNSDEVGRLHFGIVWLLDIGSPSIRRGRRGTGEITFLSLAFLRNDKARLERWSRLLVDYFASCGEEVQVQRSIGMI